MHAHIRWKCKLNKQLLYISLKVAECVPFLLGGAVSSLWAGTVCDISVCVPHPEKWLLAGDPERSFRGDKGG